MSQAPKQMAPSEFHRQLRSLFAFLRILVRDSAIGRESVDDYAAHLEGRIGALARIQEMLMRAPKEGVDLEEILCSELLAQAVPDNRYQTHGLDIRIGAESATAIAMTFHELVTNAMTYGAFNSEHGHAKIRWDIERQDDGEWLKLEWTERGVALNGSRTGYQGFGRELIERMLPYELNARTRFQLSDDGVDIQLLVPATAEALTWSRGPEE